MAPDPSESELAAREADLAERERHAAPAPADPVLLAELAQERDALADARDYAALQRRQRAADRDAAASVRDRRSRAAHGDADLGFRDRFLSGRDLDAADRGETEASGPRAGMKGRTVVGQALGLLMARLGIGIDDAFEHLVRESQSRNIKLREVARVLVDGAAGR